MISGWRWPIVRVVELKQYLRNSSLDFADVSEILYMSYPQCKVVTRIWSTEGSGYRLLLLRTCHGDVSPFDVVFYPLCNQYKVGVANDSKASTCCWSHPRLGAAPSKTQAALIVGPGPQ